MAKAKTRRDREDYVITKAERKVVPIPILIETNKLLSSGVHYELKVTGDLLKALIRHAGYELDDNCVITMPALEDGEEPDPNEHPILVHWIHPVRRD